VKHIRFRKAGRNRNDLTAASGILENGLGLVRDAEGQLMAAANNAVEIP
jgi:hypothetical protein